MKYKEVLYISASTLFSGSANEIQVLNMCSAFSKIGIKTNLVINSKNKQKDLKDMIEFYGIDLSKINFSISKFKTLRGLEFLLCLKSLFLYFKNRIIYKKKFFIFSRNLYASFLFGVIFKEHICFEIHSIESGFREIIQKLILKNNNIQCICISNSLKNILIHKYNLSKNFKKRSYVLSDCSTVDDKIFPINEKFILREEIFGSLDKNKNFIGYFGSLHEGRGLSLIFKLAELSQKNNFLIFGGKDNDIKKIKKLKNIPNNIYFMGYVSPAKSKKFMKLMDVLLMPYQQKVGIGVKDINTAEIMSPLKMFEYMASGVPLISSDLKVLKEVLNNEKNCLLAQYNDPRSWYERIEQLINSNQLSIKISKNAINDIENHFNWEKRAVSIYKIFNDES